MRRYLFLFVISAVLAGCEDGLRVRAGEGEDPVRDRVTALTAPAAGNGDVHIVRLVARGDRYFFEPDEVHVRVGEVVRFVHTDHQPESIAFDIAGAPEGGAEFLVRQNLAAGPLLTTPGAVYDVPLEGAPPGVYPFFSVPHAEFGMRGRLHVAP
ncbi:hypothetical protein BH23GEM3_BH23GEM3_16120 [soil metagenome]|nr:hypothetical protein [Gemmatimonadota bacterium]